MSLFNISEIYQIAIKIEENGELFYRGFADMFKANEIKYANEIKSIFNYLADKEIKHKKTFEKFLSEIENYEPKESYPLEYFRYLKLYAANVIFDVKKFKPKISKINTVRAALDFGIDQEWNTILYYQEIKIYVPETHQNLIDKIISEERNHFIKLSELKKNLKR